MISNTERSSVLHAISQAMATIGYDERRLQYRDYEYALLNNGGAETRKIPLAAFGQTPFSYRNSCMGVIFTNGISDDANVALHRDLGAPLIFEIGQSDIARWSFDRNGSPRLNERINRKQLPALFDRNRESWRPENVVRAKALSERPQGVQLDFFDLGYFPLIESLVKEKLHKMIEGAIRETRGAYVKSRRKEPPLDDLFRLVFRFVAGKILFDRGVPLQFSQDDPNSVLQAVDQYYNASALKLPSPGIKDPSTLNAAMRSIFSSLQFQNLSADDLAFIYENTLVTKEIRKTWGTHGTPPRIAEYIVSKLPIESLAQKSRRIFEPCSGHGIFLISAMRRLRDLLPSDISDISRHNYLKERLVGIEVDSFAVEVSRLSLMLADFPNRNDWRLFNTNIYISPIFKRQLKLADCILCNPPFEDFSQEARSRYQGLRSTHQPEEILSRILDYPPLLLGFVLPKVFIAGISYSSLHKRLAETYREMEIVSLPDKIFSHSEAETVLLMAWAKRKQGATVHVTCRDVNEQQREAFIKSREDFLPRSEILQLPSTNDQKYTIWIPRLSKLWTYLSDLPKLSQFGIIHRGIEYNIPLKDNIANRELVFSDTPKEGFVSALLRSENTIVQYSLMRSSYLRKDIKYFKGNAHNNPWEMPKILTNAFRISRGPWRLAAIYDNTGLYAYQTFHGIWPRDGVDPFFLLACLNSPIANGYIYTHEINQSIRINTISCIPIPLLKKEESYRIGGMVRHMIKLIDEKRNSLFNQNNEDSQMRDLLLKIDAELLKLYDLPPVLERELLDTFQGWDRPVRFFSFNGYYPEDFTAYLPLHMLSQERLRAARTEIILKSLSPLRDSLIHEALENAGGSDK